MLNSTHINLMIYSPCDIIIQILNLIHQNLILKVECLFIFFFYGCNLRCISYICRNSFWPIEVFRVLAKTLSRFIKNVLKSRIKKESIQSMICDWRLYEGRNTEQCIFEYTKNNDFFNDLPCCKDKKVNYSVNRNI